MWHRGLSRTDSPPFSPPSKTLSSNAFFKRREPEAPQLITALCVCVCVCDTVHNVYGCCFIVKSMLLRVHVCVFACVVVEQAVESWQSEERNRKIYSG